MSHQQLEKYKHSIVLFSGGLDSSTVLAEAVDRSEKITAISFHYGQRHLVEQLAAKKQIASYKEKGYAIDHRIIVLDSLLQGSALLKSSQEDVQKDGVDRGIPNSFVPGRNAVFLAIAMGLADSDLDVEAVWTGVNAVDYSGYPDCRPEFIRAMQGVYNTATKRGSSGDSIQIVTPIIQSTKVDIVRMALSNLVSIRYTWSCYSPKKESKLFKTEGQQQLAIAYSSCGVCDSCRIREEAFEKVGVVDTGRVILTTEKELWDLDLKELI